MMSRDTAMPTSVMLSSCTPVSILATLPDWSSLLSPTGAVHENVGYPGFHPVGGKGVNLPPYFSVFPA